MQDDFQFVWRNDGLVEQAAQLLGRDDASQVTVHFWKRLGIDRSTVLPDRAGYRSGVGLGAVGVVSIARCRERDFTFEHTEPASNEKALELGLNAYALADPVLARIPWPSYARYRKMHGTVQSTAAPLLIKPLTTVRQVR